MQNDGTDVARVQTAILRYLQQHRDAADTQDGIASWWLPVEQRAVDRLVITRALERLIADGQLEGTRLIDGTILYRRARRS